MSVEKSDGTVDDYPVSDVKRVFFKEEVAPIEAPDAAVQAGLCPDNHHPHKIDLGLDVLWSCCNLGASAPWEAGGRYAWGETEEKSVYDWDTYKYGYYNYDNDYSHLVNIGHNISRTQYDAAQVNWGVPWWMPSANEFVELIDGCTSEWTTLNGVEGRKFTGSNGGSLFIPDKSYWFSTLHSGKEEVAYIYRCNQDVLNGNGSDRCIGLMIRPVCYGIDAAVEAGLCPDNHHPHQIDLGAAGIWSCCNVGASAPWEAGDHYAWGETAEKSVYDWSTYIHCDGSSSTCHDIGSDISGTQYDAATVNWGAPWRMPTSAECQALVNCTSEWTALNDVNGRKFTGSNGNSIFLPAAGGRWRGELYSAGDWGSYWSSALLESGPGNACYLYFGSGDASWYNRYRFGGFTVRPVR